MQNSPIVVEIEAYRSHRRNGGSIVDFARKLIRKYPDLKAEYVTYSMIHESNETIYKVFIKVKLSEI